MVVSQTYFQDIMGKIWTLLQLVSIFKNGIQKDCVVDFFLDAFINGGGIGLNRQLDVEFWHP